MMQIMNKEIIEKVQDCMYRFVFEEHENTGCDCWGVTEWYTRMFVWIGDKPGDRKKQQVFDDWYIIHDGKNVIDAVSKDGLRWRKEEAESRIRTKEHLEKTGFETPREYAAYLKGKNETKDITAYEFHNMKTGHCYVDYISEPGMGEAEGYTKIQLYK